MGVYYRKERAQCRKLRHREPLNRNKWRNSAEGKKLRQAALWYEPPKPEKVKKPKHIPKPPLEKPPLARFSNYHNKNHRKYPPILIDIEHGTWYGSNRQFLISVWWCVLCNREVNQWEWRTV